jgi:DUF971 family protein
MSVAAQAWPTELRLHKDRKTLTVTFAGGEHFDLPAEYLRVKSPSAEVQGHSAEERKTVPGWDYLLDLGRKYAAYWQEYLDELAAKNLSRDPSPQR